MIIDIFWNCSLFLILLRMRNKVWGPERCLAYFNSLKWKNQVFSSDTQSYPTLCDSMDCSTPGFLSITNSRRLNRFMSIRSVMPSTHLILCHPLLLLPSTCPSIRVFSNESVFTSGGQSIGVSASASVLPMNIQDWFPLGLTGWISLLSKGLSRVFSNITVQKHQFFGAQLSL